MYPVTILEADSIFLPEVSQRIAADEDSNLRVYREIIRDSIAGALVGRIDALLAAEERRIREQPDEARVGYLNISFAESTVDDLVYLAQALHHTRVRQNTFTWGRQWTYRLLYGLIPSFIVLLGSLLFDNSWALWVGTCALILFAITGISAAITTGVALRAVAWLEEKSDGPDPDRLIRSEIGD